MENRVSFNKADREGKRVRLRLIFSDISAGGTRRLHGSCAGILISFERLSR